MTKSHPLEKDVKAGVQKIFKKHDIFWWSVPQNGFSKSGISDMMGIKAGVFFAIEVKRDVTKSGPTAMQKGFLSSITAEDGYGFTVDAARLPVLDAFFTAFFHTADKVALDAAAGKKTAETSESDRELMMNCLRTLQWEIIDDGGLSIARGAAKLNS